MNEQALKERLKNIAVMENRTFNEVWRELLLERLLVRIAQSEYRQKFVFKGGLLLSHYIEIGRETKDADFLAKELDAQMNTISDAFDRVCEEKIDDGFFFKNFGISPLLQPHMNYPGFRVDIEVRFHEKMKDRIQVDIGVGDIVEPKVEVIELYHYKGQPIFEESVSLRVYPMETIFAEKFETIIHKGATNSRMKDFHDLLLICRSGNLLDSKKLSADIVKTFNNRKTPLATSIKLSSDDIANIQKFWAAHRKGLMKIATQLNIPESVEDVIAEINQWLKKVGFGGRE